MTQRLLTASLLALLALGTSGCEIEAELDFWPFEDEEAETDDGWTESGVYVDDKYE